MVGALAFACTICVHIIRREKRLGRIGTRFGIDFVTSSLTLLFVLLAHLIEMGIWAVQFIIGGEFSSLQTGFYHSAVNYTTLG